MSKMNAEEKFEADVLLEFKNHTTVARSVLLSLMLWLFVFCVSLPGYSEFAVLFLEEKYKTGRHSHIYDLVFFTISHLFVSSLADLYGRRKVCCILSTYMFLMFIPSALFAYFEILDAVKVCYFMKYYIMPSLIMVYFINFLEVSLKCGTSATMTIASSALATVCATETLALPMPIVYRKITMTFVFTLSVFIAWYTPESPMWLLNKNKSQAVLQLLNEILGKKSDIADPTNVRDTVEHSQFKIWKEGVRYLFTEQWKNLLILLVVEVPPLVGMFTTRVVQLQVRSTILVRILLSMSCVFIIVVAFLVLRFRLSVICLNSVVCLLEGVNFVFILWEPSSSFNKSLVIIWMQYVVIWSAEILTWMFAAEIFPTFVRGLAMALILVVQYLTVGVIQISGCHNIALTNFYLSGTKILFYFVLGIVPWFFMRETPTRALSNQKLIFS